MSPLAAARAGLLGVGVGMPEFISAYSEESVNVGAVYNLPAGWQPNDLFLMHAMRLTSHAAPPAGWTLLAHDTTAGHAYGRHYLLYRIAQAGDVAPVWGSGRIWTVMAFRGVDIVNPFVTSEADHLAAGMPPVIGDPVTMASVTPSEPGLLVQSVSFLDQHSGISNPTGMAKIEDYSNNVGTNASLVHWTQEVPAGATGTRSFSATTEGVGSSVWSEAVVLRGA